MTGSWITPRTRVFTLAVALFPLSLPTAYGLEPDRVLTQYMHRIWQSQQGLPHTTIRAILQTSNGYLWLGTDHGLVRFDGVRFTAAEDAAGRDLWVRALLEDSRKQLWVLTANAGILRLEDGKLTRLVDPALPSDGVSCLASGRDGDMWACTASGLVRIQDRRVSFLPGPALEAACVSADGSVWTGGDGPDLQVWNGPAHRDVRLNTLPAFASVQAILAGRDRAIWVGSSAGLIRIQDGKERRYTRADGLANDDVLALSESADGSIWIGTNDGFSRFRNEEIDSFHTRDGLSQSTVYALYEDREGSLWAGTKRGLNQFLDRRTIPFTTSEGLPSNDTGAVLQDARGTVWIGTLGAGLGRYAGHKLSTLTAREGLASNSIYAMANGGPGELWVGTDRGLDLLRDDEPVLRLTVAQGLPSNWVRSLYTDSLGGVWIGTGAGAVIYRGGKIAPVVRDRLPVVAFIESRGEIYAAIEGRGVSVFDRQSLRELPGRSVPLRDAAAFYADPGGAIWIGGLGSGLHLLDGRRAFAFSVKDGLFDDRIYGIVPDDKDRIWLACSKGIFALQRSQLREFAAGKRTEVESNPYSPLDVLQTVECKSGVQPAAWRMQDGHLSFSSIHGLLVIDPNRLDAKTPPPPVAIESVVVDGKPENPANLKLNPGVRNLEFSYTGLSYRWPSRLTFRYRLEGFNQEWIDAHTNREAFYTNLAPGHYRFRVKACSDGGCGEDSATAWFVLPARFYQHAWFVPACVLAALAMVWLAYRFRIDRLNRQFDLILAERSRIARELHDTLIQGFAGVTMEMQAFGARLSAEQRERLDDIIRDSANCLTEARRSVANLRRAPEQNPGLSAAIAQAAKTSTAPHGIRLKLALDQIPRGLPPHVEYNLTRIAQEAVTNSVKHAAARTIEVALRSTSNLLRLSIRDDGSGFHPAALATVPACHYGLVGMRERAENIGADFRLQSSPGTGTAIFVALPIRKTAGGIRPAALRPSPRAEW